MFIYVGFMFTLISRSVNKPDADDDDADANEDADDDDDNDDDVTDLFDELVGRRPAVQVPVEVSERGEQTGRQQRGQLRQLVSRRRTGVIGRRRLQQMVLQQGLGQTERRRRRTAQLLYHPVTQRWLVDTGHSAGRASIYNYVSTTYSHTAYGNHLLFQSFWTLNPSIIFIFSTSSEQIVTYSLINLFLKKKMYSFIS